MIYALFEVKFMFFVDAVHFFGLCSCFLIGFRGQFLDSVEIFAISTECVANLAGLEWYVSVVPSSRASARQRSATEQV